MYDFYVDQSQHENLKNNGVRSAGSLTVRFSRGYITDLAKNYPGTLRLNDVIYCSKRFMVGICTS